MASAHEFVWLLGNHDPLPPEGMPGTTAEWWEVGGIVFRHHAGGSGPEVCGHHHPKASVATRAQTITRPCFVAGPQRLMLPAFGAFTGGLDVRHPAIARLFPRDAGLSCSHGSACSPSRSANVHRCERSTLRNVAAVTDTPHIVANGRLDPLV